MHKLQYSFLLLYSFRVLVEKEKKNLNTLFLSSMLLADSVTAIDLCVTLSVSSRDVSAETSPAQPLLGPSVFV